MIIKVELRGLKLLVIIKIILLDIAMQLFTQVLEDIFLIDRLYRQLNHSARVYEAG